MASDLKSISDVADVFDGPHATPTKTEEGPFFLSISSLENGRLDLSKSAHLSEEQFIEWTRRVTPEPGDLLFSYETRLGEASLMPPGIRACLGRRMGLLRPKRKKVIPEYLLYAFLSPAFQKEIQRRKIHGATVDRIGLQELPDYPIRMPEEKEQKFVVDLLLSIDKKIALNSQINETLESIARAIFQSWFVDFDPVKAKLAAKRHGRDPEKACMAALSGKLRIAPGKPKADRLDQQLPSADELDAAIAALEALSEEQQQQLAQTAAHFPDAFQPSELGEIPAGWSFGLMESLCSINPESWSKKNHPDTVDYADLANTKNGEILETQVYEWDDAPSRARRVVNGGDTIIGTVRPGNRSFALIPEAGDQLTASTGFAVLRPREAYLREFNYIGLTADTNIERLTQLADGGAYPAVRPDAVAGFGLAIPDKNLIAAFSKLARPIFDLREMNSNQCRTLAQLRDTLLPKLLSGELAIPEAESQTEDAPV